MTLVGIGTSTPKTYHCLPERNLLLQKFLMEVIFRMILMVIIIVQQLSTVT